MNDLLSEFQTTYAFFIRSGSLRVGQAAFNALHEIDRDYANKIRSTDLDPYYDDTKLPLFFAKVYEHLAESN